MGRAGTGPPGPLQPPLSASTSGPFPAGVSAPSPCSELPRLHPPQLCTPSRHSPAHEVTCWEPVLPELGLCAPPFRSVLPSAHGFLPRGYGASWAPAPGRCGGSEHVALTALFMGFLRARGLEALALTVSPELPRQPPSLWPSPGLLVWSGDPDHPPRAAAG